MDTLRTLLRPLKQAYRMRQARADRSGLNLNVGSGNQIIQGFMSLDVPSGWYHGDSKDFVAYNMITDDLPYDAGTVDQIYCSHVIEHLPDDTIQRFFGEAYRVLKPGGVLRIACPDARFLWEVSRFENSYWRWRDQWFNDPQYVIDPNPALRRRSDYFVREVATPACALYRHRRKTMDYDDAIFDRPYEEVIAELQDGLVFDIQFPGDHINAWDFDKVSRVGRTAGFTRIVASKRGASVSVMMQHPDFDQTCPSMSLYVDLVR